MTEERKNLIQEFERWFATDPNPSIIAAQCANIAEDYAARKIKESCDHPFKKLHWVDNTVFCNQCKTTLVKPE